MSLSYYIYNLTFQFQHMRQYLPQISHRCLASCFPGQMKVSWVSSEDLCVILVDRGIVEDHLPTSVLEAMNHCVKHFLRGKYDPTETDQRRKDLFDQFCASQREKQEKMVPPEAATAGEGVAVSEAKNGQTQHNDTSTFVTVEIENTAF